MNCRRAMKTDYEEICRWWVAHGWEPVPMPFLPVGFVIEHDGILKCAGFLYMDKTAPIGMLEWVVSNPDNAGTESYRSLDLLLGEITKFAKYNLIGAVYSKLVHKPLEHLYNKHGFISGDTCVKDMTWRNS